MVRESEKVVGLSPGTGRDCRWGSEWPVLSSTLNTTTAVRPLSKASNPQLLSGRRSKKMAAHCSGCMFMVCVCLFTTQCCVCTWMGEMQRTNSEYGTRHVLSFSLPDFAWEVRKKHLLEMIFLYLWNILLYSWKQSFIVLLNKILVIKERKNE